MFSTPGPRRKPGRVSRMFSTTAKSNPHPKIPRPERLDEIYVALKRGIQSVVTNYFCEVLETFSVLSKTTCSNWTYKCVLLLRDYLQAYQLDLDNCSRQMKGSKRNSRLVRFYCLAILNSIDMFFFLYIYSPHYL